MAAPYATQAISGYNSNPPADDGSAVSANRVTWANNKSKLSDPLKTLAEAINSQLVTAFAKIIGGGGVTSISTDYAVQSTDQGKLVKATASLALTMADATTVTSPFVHAFLNISGSTITASGSGGQTIDGNASITVPSGSGFLVFTDGSNWYTSGLQGTLVGKQLMYGDIINGTIAEANATNAVTYTLKTLAGGTPSSSDPVLICFRNSTVGTGNYVFRSVTSALSVTVSSGSTLGTANNVPARVWIGLLDNAGTVELFVINCLSGSNVYGLGQFPIITTTAEGGAGAADSAQVPYSTSARTSKAYVILGYAEYAAGLATAGSWNVSPTRIQLFSQGVPLPGTVVQSTSASTTTVGTTASATFAALSTGPSVAITPTSTCNIIRLVTQGTALAPSSSANQLQLQRGSTLIGNPVGLGSGVANSITFPVSLLVIDAPGSVSAQTYSFQGKTSSGTLNYPATNTGSFMEAQEVMA